MSIQLGDPPSDDNSCYDISTNFFEKPPSVYTIERVFDTVVAPSTLLRKSDRRIEFSLPASSFATDLSRMTVEFCLAIVDGDDNALPACSKPTAAQAAVAAVPANPAADPPVVAVPAKPAVAATPGFTGCAFEQFFSSCLIRNLDMRINNVSVSPLHNTYPYISYIASLMSYTAETRGSRLEAGGWVDELDLKNTDFAGYDAYAKRLKFTENNKYAFVTSSLFLPLCMQSRLLLPLCSINLDMDLVSDEFILRTGETNPSFKYQVIKASLNCRRVKLADNFQQKMEAQLVKTPAIYVTDVLNCKTNIIARGNLSFQWSDCFGSFLPSYAIVGLIRQSNVSNYACSPFCFEPLGVSSIQFNLDGATVPSRSFELNYADGPTKQHMRAYQAIFRGATQWENVSSFIDYERFCSYFTLYVFEFGTEPSTHCRDTLPVKRLEPAQLSIDFSTDQNDVIKVFLFTSSTEIIEITSQRTVLKNFVM